MVYINVDIQRALDDVEGKDSCAGSLRRDGGDWQPITTGSGYEWLVGWVEPLRNPSLVATTRDGFRKGATHPTGSPFSSVSRRMGGAQRYLSRNHAKIVR
jgi:hypothetical protein